MSKLKLGFKGNEKVVNARGSTGGPTPWDMDTNHTVVGKAQPRLEAVDKVKKALEGNETAEIEAACEELEKASHERAAELYKTQDSPGAGSGETPDPAPSAAGDDVIDAEVVDQDKGAWFHWTGEGWEDEAEPRVTHPHFAGTGTRFLEANGQAAIDALFERSFG